MVKSRHGISRIYILRCSSNSWVKIIVNEYHSYVLDTFHFRCMSFHGRPVCLGSSVSMCDRFVVDHWFPRLTSLSWNTGFHGNQFVFTHEFSSFQYCSVCHDVSWSTSSCSSSYQPRSLQNSSTLTTISPAKCKVIFNMTIHVY